MSTINVPADYATISAAVNAANPGDTIVVQAGLYNAEGPTCVRVPPGKDGLIILGAQADVDPRAGRIGAESVVTGTNVSFSGVFSVESNDVTINGFTIQGNASGAGIVQMRFVSGIQILNNIIQDNVQGIYLNSLSPAPTQNLVQFNLVQHNTLMGAASGIGVYVDQGLNDAVIDQNKFTKHTNASVDLGPVFVGAISNVRIIDNLFELDGGLLLVGVTNVQISGNTIDRSAFQGINFGGGNNLITVTDNCILSSALAGIQVDTNFLGAPNSDITITSNNITCNNTSQEPNLVGLSITSGAYNNPPLDATQNFWGSAAGPTLPNNVIMSPPDAVIFNPFLTDSPRDCPMTACDACLCSDDMEVLVEPGATGAVVTYPSPACPDVSCQPASGSFFPVGTTTVTCLSSSPAMPCSFTVTVRRRCVIVCPRDICIVLSKDKVVRSSPQEAFDGRVGNLVRVYFPPPKTQGDCSAGVSCSPASGSLFPLGKTIVTCSSPDSQCTFSVTISEKRRSHCHK